MQLLARHRGNLRQRSKDSPLRFGFEELRFIRSFRDLRIYARKMGYLLPRVTGSFSKDRPAPPSLQIEPTNLCNAACVSCPQSRSQRPRGTMEMDLFRNIIDDASSIGVERIRLFLHGEPLIHPRFVEMIRYCKSRGLSTHVTTNGVLFTREKARAFLETGVDSSDHVTFSILGSDKETHEKIMVRGNYDKEVQNIRDLLRLRTEMAVNGPVIETIFYGMQENDNQEGAYLRQWRGVVDHARLGGHVSESFAQYKKEGRSIPERTRTCPNLWEKMTVFWNGDVTICNEDVDGDWILGNLKHETITSIWNGERLKEIRKIHRDKRFDKFPFCNECDM